MKRQHILYVAIARTSLNDILLTYFPDKSEKKNESIVSSLLVIIV